MAKELDEENARNPETDPVQALDSVRQAGKVNDAIAALRQGSEVSPAQIQDALNVPPSYLSRDARTEMIKELEHAAQRDELGEQTHNPGNDWLAWDSYRKQRERADSALKALERGEDLPWSEIQEALQVPEYE